MFYPMWLVVAILRKTETIWLCLSLIPLGNARGYLFSRHAAKWLNKKFKCVNIFGLFLVRTL